MNSKETRLQCYSQLYMAMQLEAKNNDRHNTEHMGVIIETEADILNQFGLPWTSRNTKLFAKIDWENEDLCTIIVQLEKMLKKEP